MLKRWFAVPPDQSLPVGEKAGRYFDQGYNCAQSVLLAICGPSSPELLEIAKSFGAGIGGAKCLCGAVSGGVMALSLKGKGKQGDRLVAAFRQRHRVTCCSALSKPYQWKSAEHRANCRALTVSAAEITAQILRGETVLDRAG